MEILKVENLSFTYPLMTSPALSDVSFSAEKGEFIAVCGATGSGKSTLLRMLKNELAPVGERSGEIYIDGVAVNELGAKKSAAFTGYVMQNPEHQIVTDTVWHELAFGLENMNIPPEKIAGRIAEISAYFGIEQLYLKSTHELSGGQKQLLNLAAVMVMNPDILVLDEPTAQLDPIAASEFISTVKKLNRELGLTVIISEHRLEEVIPVCDRVLMLEKGSVYAYGKPQSTVSDLKNKPSLLRSMPAAVRLFHAVNGQGECPLDVCHGRAFIQSAFSNKIRTLPLEKKTAVREKALEFKNVMFRYERDVPDVLNGLTFTAYKNEICCILGGNGSGKSTALSAAAALIKPYSGEIRIFGKKLKEYKNQSLYRECLALLPQDVQTVFLRNTVREELADVGAGELPFEINHLLDKHPYDLSGGEQQLAALAKVLASKPKLLLLDEPTKGIDAETKHTVAEILKRLKQSGVTIIIVTHDTEFACECADRCAMFFRGNIVSSDTPRNFFAANNFYTTAASRMTRGFYDNVTTVDEAAELIETNGTREDA
ncbi:MAG: energy-coupling factor ABC transporter ATP-binding protein [Oscillospiraceae bacterium]|nr:energy-coupling factor ABC transporter ATP-binding protein [Oscillospiraceae bacterium]